MPFAAHALAHILRRLQEPLRDPSPCPQTGDPLPSERVRVREAQPALISYPLPLRRRGWRAVWRVPGEGLLLLLILALAAPCARAATLNVPSSAYPTIQAGINAAVNGDTVLVADGTYTGPGNVDLDFGGRNITVASVNGPAVTVIDCQGSASTPHRGFIFQHQETSAATVSGFTIQNGYAGNPGSILVNGGGILAFRTSPTISHCIFLNNQAAADGGAIYSYGGQISACAFLGNSAAHGGGLFLFTVYNALVLNCAFIGNTAASSGGGIGFAASPSITNCTFTANTAQYGGGMEGGNYGAISSALITNCLLWGDAASVKDNELNQSGTGFNPQMTYCDVQGGYAGTGNINVDPLFARPPNLSAVPPDYGDSHLQSGSPCIGAGTPNYTPTTDFDGNTRPNPPSIGAFEFIPPVYITNATIGPATLPMTGGTLSVSADVALPAGVRSVSATLYANGVPVSIYPYNQLSLTATGSGTTYAASYNPGVNRSSGPIVFTATIMATDTQGSVFSASAVGSCAQPSELPPVVSSATVTPANVSAQAGTVQVSATVTFPHGFSDLYAYYPLFQNGGTTFVQASMTGPDANGVYTCALPYAANTGSTSLYHQVFIMATDTLGQKTNPYVGSFNQAIPDTTPPATTAALSGTLGSNGYYVGPVTVTLAATDTGGSGVAATSYSVDSGAAQAYSAPFSVTGDGAHSVTFFSADNAGNTEAQHYLSVGIDTAPPVTTASMNGATVTLAASDALSGVASTFYSIDNGAQQTYSGPFTVSGGSGTGHSIAFFSTDNAGNSGTSQTLAVTVPYPAPTLSALSSSSAVAGAPAFTLTLTGTGFISGASVVQWNGSALATTFVSGTKLKATVPNSLLASAGTAQVTAVNPAPGGGVSNAKTFTITLTSVKVTVGTPTRAAGTSVLSVPLTVQNTGDFTAPNAQVTASKLGGYATLTPLPVTLGDIAPGASATVTLAFPKKSGAAGSAKTLTVNGTYGGGAWSATVTVALP